MALEVGAVYASAGVRVDESGFHEYARALGGARADASKKIVAEGRAEVDESGFARFRRALGLARAEASKDVVAVAKVDVDSASFAKLSAARKAAVVESTAFKDATLRLEEAHTKARAAMDKHGAESIRYRRAIVDVEKAQAVLTTTVEKGTQTVAGFGGSIGGGGIRASFGVFTGNVGAAAGAMAAAIPIAVALAGAATAVAGSAAAAAGGLGALGIAGGAALGPLAALAAAVAARFTHVKEAYDALQAVQEDNSKANRQKLREAEAGLSGMERRTVNVLGKVSDAVDRVFGGATDRVFEGLARNVDRLLPTFNRLEGPFSRLGGAVERAMDRAGRALSGPGWSSALTRFVNASSRLVAPFTTIFLGIARIIRDVAVAALPLFERAVGGAADAVRRFSRGASFENIRDVVRTLIGHTASWWGLLKQVGELIFRVFNGGASDGRSLVDTLTHIIDRWNAFLSTKRGQDEMRRFFRDAIRLTRDIVGMLASLASGAFKAYTVLAGAYHVIAQGLRPVIRFLTGDFSGAWAAARENVKLSLGAIVSLAQGIVGPVMRAMTSVSRTLAGGLTTVLGLAADALDVASKVPGVGGKFKGLADDIRRAQRNIDDYRDSLDKTHGSHRRAAGSADDLNDKVNIARGRYRAAKAPLDNLKKGTDEYRAAARIARQRQDDLNDAIRNARNAQRPAARAFGTIAASVAGMAEVVADSVGSVGGNVNDVLKDLGAKSLRYTIRHPKRAGATLGAFAGFLRNLATGGIPNPGGGAADDHILVDPRGRPVAAMSGTEGVVNQPQMGIIDYALKVANAIGAVPWRGLQELWGSGMRHYAGGGQIVSVPGFPGERAASRVVPLIEQIAHRFNLTLTDAYGQGHKSPGHTRYGTAADFAGPDRNMDRAVAALVRAGYLVGYDGRFGSQRWPGHGPTSVAGGNAHLHVELGGKGGNIGIAEIARRVIAGPAGTLRTVAQRSSDRVVDAANDYLSRQAVAPVAGGGTGGMGKRALAALWRSVNPGLGNPNLMAAIALAESGGRANIVNSIGAGGLWQINPPEPNYLNPVTNARIAGRKLRTQGLRAWEAFTNGSYRQYLRAGGMLRRLATGGRLAGNRNQGAGDIRGISTNSQLVMRTLRDRASDNIGDYNDVLKDVEREQRHYGQVERRYNQSDEVLIDPTTGELNQPAIDKRAGELDRLKGIRQKIVNMLKRAERIAVRVRKTYATIIDRLERSLKHAKKKDRAGIRKQISGYRGRRASWMDTLRDTIRPDLIDARLDVGDIAKEAAEVRGTNATATADDAAGAGGAADPDVEAIAAQATARADALAADLSTARQNLAVFTGPGDLGTGGGAGSAFAAGTFAGPAGTDPIAYPAGSAAAGRAGQAGGTVVNVNVASFVPPSGAEQQRLAGVVVGALDAQGAVPATRERVP